MLTLIVNRHAKNFLIHFEYTCKKKDKIHMPDNKLKLGFFSYRYELLLNCNPITISITYLYKFCKGWENMQTVFVCIFVGTGVLDCPHNHEFALCPLRHPSPPHYDFRAFFFSDSRGRLSLQAYFSQEKHTQSGGLRVRNYESKL